MWIEDFLQLQLCPTFPIRCTKNISGSSRIHKTSTIVVVKSEKISTFQDHFFTLSLSPRPRRKTLLGREQVFFGITFLTMWQGKRNGRKVCRRRQRLLRKTEVFCCYGFCTCRLRLTCNTHTLVAAAAAFVVVELSLATDMSRNGKKLGWARRRRLRKRRLANEARPRAHSQARPREGTGGGGGEDLREYENKRPIISNPSNC